MPVPTVRTSDFNNTPKINISEIRKLAARDIGLTARSVIEKTNGSIYYANYAVDLDGDERVDYYIEVREGLDYLIHKKVNPFFHKMPSAR